jgi:hypothetical protein
MSHSGHVFRLYDQVIDKETLKAAYRNVGANDGAARSRWGNIGTD